MNWYAIEHRYGSNVQDNDGDHIGEVFAFPTKAARAEWMKAGPVYFELPGFRAILNFRDRRDRSAIRRFKGRASV